MTSGTITFVGVTDGQSNPTFNGINFISFEGETLEGNPTPEIDATSTTSDPNTTAAKFVSNDGSEFQLNGFDIDNYTGNALDVTITGFRNGSAVAGASYTLNMGASGGGNWITVAAGDLGSNFDNVDEVRFSTSPTISTSVASFAIDNVVIADAVTNNPPTASNKTLNVNENGVLTIATSDFGYSDTDSDPLDHVRITAVPASGNLWVDSDGSGTINGAESALTNNATVSKANLDAGRFKYQPSGSTNSSFTFDVNDGTEYSASTYTMTLTVNSSPVISNLNGDSGTFTEGGSALVLDSGTAASVTDSDATGYNGGNVTVAITSPVSTEDLIISTAGTVSLSAGMTANSVVSVSGTSIGTITSGKTGQDGLDLIVTLNSNATDARIGTLLRNITYTNASQNPSGTKTVGFSVTDAVGGTSSTASVTVTLAATNDDPTFTGKPTDITVTEDVASNVDLSSATFADVDAGSNNVTLTISAGAGTLSVAAGAGLTFTGNATSTITITGVVSTIDTYLNVASNIKYTSASNASGGDATTLTISGTDNGNTGTGGGGNISFGTVNVDITAVNDAPVLDNTKSPALTGINEDLAAPTNGSTANSTLVSSLIDNGGPLDNYSDVEGDSPGIAIIGVNSGTVYYSVNGGTNWSALGAVNATSAIVLNADASTRVYFKPDANISGSITNAMIIKAWDRTTSSNGSTGVNTTTGTAFSSATDDVSLVITAVNDAPVLDNSQSPALTGITEDAGDDDGSGADGDDDALNNSNNPGTTITAIVVDGSITDLDGGAVEAIAVTVVDNTNGIWQYTTDNGSTWNNFTGITGSSVDIEAAARLLDGTLAGGSTNKIRFVPDANYNGTATITFRAWDKSSGSAGSTANASSNGGSSSFSSASDNASISISAVNDAPQFSNLNATPSFTEGGSVVQLDNNVTISDVELDALNGGNGNYSGAGLSISRNGGANANDRLSAVSGGNLTVAGGPVGGGTITAGGNVIVSIANTGNGQIQFTFSNTGTIPNKALVNEVMQAIRYSNASDDPASSVQLNWSFSDGNSGDTQGTGANPATGTGSVTVGITGVNDPPTLTATGQNPTYTEGGAGSDLYSAVTASTVEGTQNVIELRLTVTNVSDGSSELLSIDGSDIALIDDNSGTTTNNSMSLTVTVPASTATVTITKGAGVSAATVQTIVDGIQYKNTSENPSTGSNRIVTLTYIKDYGGTTNGGDDNNVLAISSTVSLTAVNDPPVVGNVFGDNTSEVIAGSGVQNIADLDDATVTNADSPDYNGGFLTISQGSGTANGSFGVDGSTATSGGDATIAAGETIAIGGTSIGTVHATNDGQGGNNLQIDFNSANATSANLQTLIRSLTYSAPSGLGARVFTLTLDDNDGTANGGDKDASGNFTITITPNPPVLGNINGDNPSIPVGGAAGNIDVGGNATVTDADSPNFNGGNLTIAQNTGTANGNFSVSGSGASGVASGSSLGTADGTIAGSEIIYVDGVAIASVSAVDNGQSGNNLKFNFGSNATPARTQSILRDLKYAAPSGTGDRTFTISIQDAAANFATGTANITITIAPPEIGLKQNATPIGDGGSYDFGDQSLNSNTDITFTIENTGSGSLTFTTPLTLGGADAGQFSIQNQPTSPVASSGSTTFTVRFTPTSFGTKTATIVIVNNDTDENPYNLTLNGTGNNPPTVTINQAGAQSDPSNSATINFTAVFNEVVTGFTTGDVTLSGTAGATTATVTGGAATYNVAVTGMTNDGTVTVSIGAGKAVDSGNAPNLASTSTDNSVTFDQTLPSGYTVSIDQSVINISNKNSVSFRFGSAEVGATYNYTFTNDGGGGTVTGNGVVTTSEQQVSGINLDGLADGTINLSVTLTDAAGNTGEAATDSRSRDASAPSIWISSPENNSTNKSPFEISFTFSEIVTGFGADDVTIGNGTIYNFTGSGTTYSAYITPASDGLVTVDVAGNTAQDASGNGNSGASQYSVIYDGYAPSGYTVSIDQQVINSKNKGSVSFRMGSAEVGATYNYTFTSSGGGTASGSGTIQTATDQVTGIDLSGLTDGTITLSVTLTDPAGNTGSASTDTKTKDTAGPTVAISSSESSPTNTSPFSVTIAFSEPVTGFELSDIITGNGTAGNLSGSGTTYTADITPSTDGTVTVDVAANIAEDGSGNSNSAAQQFIVTYDTAVPTVQITSTETSPTSSSPFSITITFSKSVTGLTAGDITVGNGSVSNLSGSGTTYTAAITPSSDGSVTVDIAANAASDAAGNGNTAATQFSINYDGTEPSVSISSNTSSPTNSSQFSITIKFSESVTGFELGDIIAGNATADNLAGTGTTYTADITPSSDGTVTVDVAANAALDVSGNGNTSSNQFTLSYDGTAPDVQITSTEVSPTNKSPFDVTITFSEPVSGFELDDIMVTNGTAGNLTGTETTYTAEITPVSEGLVTVDIPENTSADGAGNGNTAAGQFSINYDQSAPTVEITSNATSPTNLSPVKITITFSEDVEGFELNDAVLTNATGINFTEVSSQKYEFDLTPQVEGIFTVSVPADVCTDSGLNGNEASVPLQILYDSTPPSVQITTDAESVTGNKTANISIVFSEPVEGFTSDEITPGNGQIVSFSQLTITTEYTAEIEALSGGEVTVNVPAGVSQDAAGNTNLASEEVSFVYNVLPVISISNTTEVEYTEGSTGVGLFGGLEITDSDDTNLEGAVISISTNFIASEDKLDHSGISSNAISVDDSDPGTVRLTGSATIEQYKSAISSIKYVNENDTDPDASLRTITLSVNDDIGISNEVSNTIKIVLENDAPEIASTSTGAIEYTEDGDAVVIDGGLEVKDIDNTTLQHAEVIISSNYKSNEDEIDFIAVENIQVSFDTNTGTLNLSGEAPVSDYQSVLRSVGYRNTSDAPNTEAREVSIVVNDGNDNSNVLTRTIEIIPVNDMPVLSSLESDTLEYTESQGAVGITGSVEVTDPDNSTLEGATIAISEGYVSGEDVLGFTGTGEISGSFNGSTGVLALTGSASLQLYRDVLRSVTYENTSTNPSTEIRLVTITASDGTDNSLQVERVLKVIPLNNAPEFIAGGIPDAEFDEDLGTTLLLSEFVSDLDNPVQEINFSAEVLSVGGNTPSLGGETLSAGKKIKTTTSDLSIAIDNITKTAILSCAKDSNGVFRVEITATDTEGGTARDTMEVRVNPVNDAPVISGIPDVAFPEDSLTILDLSEFIKDVDNNLEEITISVSIPIEPLTIIPDGDDSQANVKTGKVKSKSSAKTEHVTLSNQTGQIRMFNDSLLISIDQASHLLNISGVENFYKLNMPVYVSVSDGQLTSNTDTLIVDILSVNDAPEISLQLAPITFNEDELLNLRFSELYPFVNDPDNPDSTLEYEVNYTRENFTIEEITDTMVTIRPRENWFGLDTVSVIVSDGLLSASASLGISVLSVNDLPVITGLTDTLDACGSEAMVINLWEIVEDVETPDELLSFSFTASSDTLNVEYNSLSGDVTLSTPASFDGDIDFTITVTDADNGEVSGTTVFSTCIITSLEALAGLIPNDYILEQNYPNPFNPTTTIRYGLPEESSVSVVIYNILGQVVLTLKDDIQKAGYYEEVFNANYMASGIYIYSIASKSLLSNRKFNQVRKMILIK